MKQRLTRLGLVLILGLGTFSLWSQVTTANLKGTVTDTKGIPLIGATVVAIHLPSGTQYGTMTREDGGYTLPNLRVGGPYQVEAYYLGFSQEDFEDIQLSLAQKLTLDFSLKEEGITLEEVEVVAQADPILNNKRTGAATNIGPDELKNLPTIFRSASDYTRLTPSADGNSFAGRNDQFNNFSLDGSIFNNPFGLDAATPGGQTDAQPISLDAIEQIQVSIAPFDVTQAGFTGAAVNAVTKSGTNKFSGTVFGFFRNQDLTGSKVNGKSIFVPDLRQLQTGFSLGGPIIKDKLFFFVNAELERRQDLGSNFIAAGPDRSGENVSRVEASDLQLVSNTLNQAFGYDTGPFENFTHETNNQKGIFKLDWNIKQSHTLTASYNFLDASKEKPAHPTALGRRGPDATTLQFFNSGYQINNIIHSGIVEWRALFSNRVSNKLQVGFTAFRDSRDPMSEPFPVVNINQNGIRYIIAGHEPFSIHNRLDQDVFQASNNLNIYASNHTLTFGASIERFNFDNSFNLGVYEPFDVPYPGGTFGAGFNSVPEFVDFVQSGEMDPVVDYAGDVFRTNGGDEGAEGEGWALAETNVGQFAVYAQDEWAVNTKFTLTYGIRMDMPLYFNTVEKIEENLERKSFNYFPDIVWYDENGGSVQYDHRDLPKQTPLWSPRVGFNWNIKGDETSQLRGGTGIFSGRLPFVWIGNQVANPDWFFYSKTANDFKFPQVWRSNIGYDHRFGAGWIATLDLIYTKDLNAAMVRNYSLKPPTTRLSGVDNRLIYTDADRAVHSDFGFPISGTGYIFTNTDIGKSFNASFQLRRRFASGLNIMLGYNYLDAKDATSIEAEISGDAFAANPALGNVNLAMLAPSIYGNRHRILGSAYQKFTYGSWATSLALFFQYAEGGRFSYTYSGDINGDGSGLNDLLYIPTSAEIDQMQFEESLATAEAQRAALEDFIQQDDYLSSHRGGYVEKYGLLSPWYSNWDARILQDLNLPNGNVIQFSIDILNVGNLISGGKWGVRQFPTVTQPIGVTVENGVPTYSFDTSLTSSFTDDFSLLSRWQMQFGLRYSF